MRDAVLIFHSLHKVMLAEKVLKGEALDVRLMPVPRQLSSDCGLSLTFPWCDRDVVIRALAQAGCPAVEVYQADGNGGYRRAG